MVYYGDVSRDPPLAATRIHTGQGDGFMEKGKPTYDLEAIQACAGDPHRFDITTTALVSAATLGFDRLAIVETVQSITKNCFYKSMTAHFNPRIWQDVYHVPSDAGLLYVKFTAGVITEFTLLSFKEK